MPLEVECSKKLGFNLGIKLIRGAYMNEERKLAAEGKYESPVHETIEDTHKCYNTNLRFIMSNLRPKDKLFLGSHNVDSVNLAKSLIKDNGLNPR